MKKCFAVIFFALVLSLSSAVSALAQDRKLVVGRVTEKTTGKPVAKDVLIEIYAFDTIGAAEDALAIFRSGDQSQTIRNHYNVDPPDEYGYYQYSLPETGAFIFRVNLSNDPTLEKVNYRSEINVSVESGHTIQASTKTVSREGIRSMEEDVIIDGDTLRGSRTIFTDKHAGSTNSRLILQPYFMDGSTNDTIAYLRPMVFDGREYRLTQERRMAYNMENDPLIQYVDTTELHSGEFEIFWHENIYLKNPNGRYYVKGKLIVEDYNTITYVQDSITLASSRARRPMQFLDYDVSSYELNPHDYFERARPSRVGAAGAMSLTFLVNEAKIDDRDTSSINQLTRLRDRISGIIHGENSTLKEFHIKAYSSPDGPYAKNEDLGRRRKDYAVNRIYEGLTQRSLDRFWHTEESFVAPWSNVADSLEKDSLMVEAAEVRNLVEKNSKSPDAQWQAIRKLAYYKEKISPILSKMRKIDYTFDYEEVRELTPEEILKRYREEEDYKTGKLHFAVYEYWHLFRMLEEAGASKDELMALYKRAYDETFEDNGTPWPYAANKYAIACMDKGIVDTTILAPLIDDKYKCNYGLDRKGNPDPIVANQLRMFLMNSNFKRASVMAQMLPKTDQYKTLQAVTMCLGGYWRISDKNTQEENQQRTEWYEIVRESTPVNKVVMLLARNTAGYNQLAEQAIAELPETDPLTWYFKAIIISRKRKMPGMEYDYDLEMLFEQNLINCFDLDSKYVAIARSDGDIDEDQLKNFFKYNPQYDAF